jgi:protein involved in polysaccharide export with SLBB domain
LAQAGGISQVFADKIYVIRPQPDGAEDVVIEISLKRAKLNREENIRLQPGDVVSVEQTSTTMVFETLKALPLNFGASIPIF